VAHQFPPQLTGIGNVAAAEAERLAAAGNEVTVLTTGTPSGVEHHTAGYQIVRAPSWDVLDRKRGIPFPFVGRQMLVRARDLVRWSDVVHIHDTLYMPCWAAAVYARRAGRPTIVTQHVATIAHPSRITRAAQRVVYGGPGAAILRRADRVIVLNDRVAEFVRDLGADPSRVRLIPNGVDADRFRPAEDGEQEQIRKAYDLPPDAVLALFVGRLVPKKGADRLLRAVDDAYVIAFAGGDRPDGTPDDARTIFLGMLTPDQVAEVYRAADMFVLPSESEGFPLSAQEAMASALPVVLRGDPGYASYGLESAGVRFIDGDPESIRTALRRLAADPDERRDLGACAHTYATTYFGWDLHAARLMELWDEILRSR
jgi:D-inositol-3-phosphate glycosyltransferase